MKGAFFVRLRPTRVTGLCALLLAALGGACTYDFAAPFAQSDDDITPKNPKADGGSSGTSSGDPIGDGTCKFSDDYAGVLGTPTSWFRLDEASGDFKGQPGSKVEYGYRKANVAPIERGALRSPNHAQYLANSQIGFGDAWRDFTGSVAPGSTNITPRLAVELWFRLRTISAAPQTLMSKLGSDSTTGFVVRISGAGALRFERFGGSQLLALDAGQARPEVWHHFVLQIDDKQITAYLDGKPRSVNTTNASVTNAGGAFLVGPFDGDVDELAAYDRLLTNADVAARVDAATSKACAAGATNVCFGPQNKGSCLNGLPTPGINCQAQQACVMNGGRAECVEDTCPTK